MYEVGIKIKWHVAKISFTTAFGMTQVAEDILGLDIFYFVRWRTLLMPNINVVKILKG